VLQGWSLSDVRRIRFLTEFDYWFLTEFCGSGMRCVQGEARHVAVYTYVYVNLNVCKCICFRCIFLPAETLSFLTQGKLRKPENERKKQVNAHERIWSVLATD